MSSVRSITPFLWFDANAEEAVNFYVSVFDNARIIKIHRYTAAGPAPEGHVMTIDFELEGQRFVALNGGPHYKFTPAVSFAVSCKTQADVDRMWARLTDGGQEVQCGWLVDKFGLSWQVWPEGVMELTGSDDRRKAEAAMRAMFTMKKLDIVALKKAYDAA